MRKVAGPRPTSSPSACTRARSCGHGADLGGPQLGDLGVGDVRALVEPRQVLHHLELVQVAQQDQVKEAVGGVGVGGDEHAAAKVAAVGGDDAVELAGEPAAVVGDAPRACSGSSPARRTGWSGRGWCRRPALGRLSTRSMTSPSKPRPATLRKTRRTGAASSGGRLAAGWNGAHSTMPRSSRRVWSPARRAMAPAGSSRDAEVARKVGAGAAGDDAQGHVRADAPVGAGQAVGHLEQGALAAHARSAGGSPRPRPGAPAPRRGPGPR